MSFPMLLESLSHKMLQVSRVAQMIPLILVLLGKSATILLYIQSLHYARFRKPLIQRAKVGQINQAKKIFTSGFCCVVLLLVCSKALKTELIFVGNNIQCKFCFVSCVNCTWQCWSTEFVKVSSFLSDVSLPELACVYLSLGINTLQCPVIQNVHSS